MRAIALSFSLILAPESAILPHKVPHTSSDSNGKLSALFSRQESSLAVTRSGPVLVNGGKRMPLSGILDNPLREILSCPAPLTTSPFVPPSSKTDTGNARI
ncbi:hypothetical protein C8R43DRAFT_994244 [Mycena crocata]|nr:hypothetical protein C8R43DRAFT_994244 [Mycena crocata]